MASVVYKGYNLSTNSEAYEIAQKGDDKAFKKHMEKSKKAAKELMEKGNHLEQPLAPGMSRWVIGVGLVYNNSTE